MPKQEYSAPAPREYSAPAPKQQYSATAPMPNQQYSAPASQQYSAPASQQYSAPAPMAKQQYSYNEEPREQMPEIQYNPCSYANTEVFHAAQGLSNNYFIHCDWEYPYLFKCPGGLVWNQEIQACDYANRRTMENYQAPAYA